MHQICTREMLDKAVAAAAKSFPLWSNSPYKERQSLLNKIADLLEQNVTDLSQLLTAEHGKTLSDAAMEHRISYIG